MRWQRLVEYMKEKGKSLERKAGQKPCILRDLLPGFRPGGNGSHSLGGAYGEGSRGAEGRGCGWMGWRGGCGNNKKIK